MRSVSLLTAAFVILLGLTQCVEKSENPTLTTTNDSIVVIDTILLGVGDNARVEYGNMEIGFKEVLIDTRTPPEQIPDPMEPGYAVIGLWLKFPGQDTINIRTDISYCGSHKSETSVNSTDTLGLRFSLFRLEPCPYGPPIPQDEYQAWIEIKTHNSDFSIIDSVIITDLPQDSIEIDGFDLYDNRIRGDRIRLSIAHSGGCREHEYQLYMSPPAFSESNPVKADLYLRHDANGDACEAYIQRNLYFNIRPIADLYQAMYGRLDTIIIQVNFYREDYGLSYRYVPQE